MSEPQRNEISTKRDDLTPLEIAESTTDSKDRRATCLADMYRYFVLMPDIISFLVRTEPIHTLLEPIRR